MWNLFRRTIFGSLLASIISIPSFGDAEQKRLTIRMRDTGPPVQFIDSNGAWSGFVIEATTELGKRAGFEIDVVAGLSWKRALEMTKAGELDLLHSASWREERTEFLDYIGPYDMSLMALLVQRGTKPDAFDTLGAFSGNGKNFAKGLDVALSLEFDEKIKTDPGFASHFSPMQSTVRQKESTQFVGLFQRIAEGAVTGFIAESGGLAQIMASPEKWGISADIMSKIDVVYPKVFDRDATFLTASKALDPEVRKALHASYDSMRADGTFSAIWEKWRPGVPEPKVK